MHLKTTSALLAASALFLGACGGSSDEDQIRGIVDDVAKDPASLCDNIADKPLKEIGGIEGCKALAAKQEKSDAKAESVVVDGDDATAKVTSDGKTNDAKFSKIDGKWKLSLE